MRLNAMLEQIDVLPGAERQAAAGNGYRELRAGQDAADMGRHVVGALVGVAIKRGVFADQAGEKGLQIPQHVGVGVLLDGQRRAGVLAKQGEQAVREPLAFHPSPDLGGDGVQALAAGFDGNRMLRLFHGAKARTSAGPPQYHRAIAPPARWRYEEDTMKEQVVNVADRTAEIARGATRLLVNMGYRTLPELPLANGRRVDVIGLDRQGRFVVVEVKSSVADFRADGKWLEYLPYCDSFYFAVHAGFPLEILPGEVGVIVADAYDGALRRAAPVTPMPPHRRRALTVRFARTAAARLDPAAAVRTGFAIRAS